jgi:polysaccharide pyruvyl transferase WcaK-like protein
MHACIAAMSQGIPTIGLAYSKKFAGVFQSIGVDQFVVDMRYKTTEEILDLINKAFQDRDAAAEHLRRVIPCVQKQILEVFGQLL